MNKNKIQHESPMAFFFNRVLKYVFKIIETEKYVSLKILTKKWRKNRGLYYTEYIDS